MKERCNNPDNRNYPNWGGRGIKVCERWENDFLAFLEDMGESPPKAILDRKDNNGNYEPGNCRWATFKESMNNTRYNVLITWKGQTKTLKQWAETTGPKSKGLTYKRIHSRLAKGWSFEKAILTPPYVNRTTFLNREKRTQQ